MSRSSLQPVLRQLIDIAFFRIPVINIENSTVLYVIEKARLMKCVLALAVSLTIFVMGHAPSMSQEQSTLACQCVVATSLCAFARFDEAAGKPRHEWTQPIFLGGNEPAADLRALACWRKREVGGGGLCCSKDDDERDAPRYFSGDIQ